MSVILFFFNDTATTEIYPLSLHDALPICQAWEWAWALAWVCGAASSARHASCDACTARAGSQARASDPARAVQASDRKSTRLNSSHSQISYAVFCLKKKNTLTSKSDVIHI